MKMDIGSFLRSLQAQSLKGKKTLTGMIGYSAPYALYVHENLEARHPNGGQAKFLEQPMRTEQAVMEQLIYKSLKNKDGLQTGIRRALNHVLTVSKTLVPVDTGFLRDSGFVEV